MSPLKWDEESRAVFRRWWDSEPSLRGVRLIVLEDIIHVTDKIILGVLHSIGGAHLVCGGSPCSQLSGLNQCLTTENGRQMGLEGEASRLWLEWMRVARVAASVPLLFRRRPGA